MSVSLGPRSGRGNPSNDPAGRPKRHAANTFNTTDLKINSAKGQGHDHEELMVLPRYKAFITPEPFMEIARPGE